MVFLSHSVRLLQEAHRFVHRRNRSLTFSCYVYNQTTDCHIPFRLISTLATILQVDLTIKASSLPRFYTSDRLSFSKRSRLHWPIVLPVIRCILGPCIRKKAFSPFTYLTSYCGSIVDQPSASLTSRLSRQTPFMVRILTGRTGIFDSNPFFGLQLTLTPQILQNKWRTLLLPNS